MSTQDSKAESNGIAVGTLEDSRQMQPTQPPQWGRSFAELMRDADTVDGGDLLKGEDPKADLIGVPFLIYRATFRDGITDKKAGTIANYVSLDIITADAETYRLRQPFMPDVVKFPPNSSLVFNDGSTGVCRQITEYLHTKGLIKIRDISPDEKTGGAAGESPFDTYRAEWESPRKTIDIIEDGGRYPDITVDCRLYLPRGLRVSEYDGAGTGKTDSRTYYFG